MALLSYHRNPCRDSLCSLQWDAVLGLVTEQIQDANATYSNTTWWGLVEPMARGIMSGAAGEEGTDRPSIGFSTITFSNLTATAKEAIMSLNLTSAEMTSYMNVGAKSGKVMASTLINFTDSMFALFSESAASFILFVSVVMLLLNSPYDPLTKLFTDLLPQSFPPSTPSYISEMLCGVLLLPLKLAATHAVVIVSFISLFGAKHSFLAAGLSFLQAFFPIAPAFLIPVPWALCLVIEGAWARGLLCFVGVKAALSWCDERVMRKQVGMVNPMFTSLSVLMGYRR